MVGGAVGGIVGITPQKLGPEIDKVESVYVNTSSPWTTQVNVAIVLLLVPGVVK